jgi:hypothetical protein
MRVVDAQINILASPSHVWRILVDFPAYSDWNPYITEIEGRPESAARLRVRARLPGRAATTLRPRILVAAREWELRWHSRRFVPGLFDREHSFRIRTQGRSCRFLQSERFTGLFVGAVDDDVFAAIQRGFQEMNAALKRRAEAV